jgi:hypothetical protein
MSVSNYSCPACGAPLEVENRFSRTVICQYCGQTSFITPTGLDPTGQKAELADFESIFSVGRTGKLRGEPFKTLGRLRFKYDEGFWDEWFLKLGAKNVWLQEDEGLFTAFSKQTITTAIPPFADVRVGSSVPVNTYQVFVVEKNEAVIAGGEGELYFKVNPGEAVNYVDGNAAGQVVSIEYLSDEINLSIGSDIDLHEIEFDSR